MQTLQLQKPLQPIKTLHKWWQTVPSFARQKESPETLLLVFVAEMWKEMKTEEVIA